MRQVHQHVFRMNQISMCPIVSFGFKMVAFYENWSNDFYLLFSYLRLSDALCHKICHFYTRNCCIHLTDGEFLEYAKQKRNKCRHRVLPHQNNLFCVDLVLELNTVQITWPWSFHWHVCSIVCAGKSTRICGWCGINSKFVITTRNESIDLWVD